MGVVAGGGARNVRFGLHHPAIGIAIAITVVDEGHFVP